MLCAGLYSPEEVEELQSCTDAVDASMEVIGSELPCCAKQDEDSVQLLLQTVQRSCQQLQCHLQDLIMGEKEE